MAARIIEWVVGAIGAFTVFLGLFILFAGDDQYLGYAGSTWRVGDIAAGWGYGFLLGGIALLAVVLALVMLDHRHPRVR